MKYTIYRSNYGLHTIHLSNNMVLHGPTCWPGFRRYRKKLIEASWMWFVFEVTRSFLPSWSPPFVAPRVCVSSWVDCDQPLKTHLWSKKTWVWPPRSNFDSEGLLPPDPATWSFTTGSQEKSCSYLPQLCRSLRTLGREKTFKVESVNSTPDCWHSTIS